jgi:hypothetical protein
MYNGYGSGGIWPPDRYKDRLLSYPSPLKIRIDFSQKYSFGALKTRQRHHLKVCQAASQTYKLLMQDA